MSMPPPAVAIKASDRYRLERLARVAADRGDVDALLLLGELTRAESIPNDDDRGVLRSRVTMGACVTYWTEAGTCGVPRNTRQLVYPDQYRFWRYQLSILSPLGSALIGLRVGSQMPFFQHGTMHYVRVESLDKPSSNVVRLLFNKEASSGHNVPPSDDDPGPNVA